MQRNWSCRRAAILLVFVTSVCAPRAASAQATIDGLQRELASLRRELQQLRDEVHALKAAGPAAAPADPARVGRPQEPILPPPLHAGEPDEAAAPAQIPSEMLAQQVAELAQVKVESGSRMPVRIFGTVHASAFYNSGEANWLDNPNIVAPKPEDARTGTFSVGVRQTRLGLAVDGPTLGRVRTSGQVVADFFGGIPGFQTGQTIPLPRLLVAFARFDTGRTAIEVGQDHVVGGARDPTSLAALAFPSLFRSGNLYLRAPQVRVEQALGAHVQATGAIVAPIGGDLAGEDYRFVPPPLAGERSRRPAVEARLALHSTTETDALRLAGVAVSGHYGSERRASGTEPAWAVAVDFAARRERFGVAGEIFRARNADAFGGATGLDMDSAGGWSELQLFPSSRLSVHAGAGIDDLRDVASAVLPRRRNRSAYGNVIISITPEVRTSLEYRWLGTTPGSGGERDNHHLNWALAYTF